MAALGTQFAQIKATHQHRDTVARLPTQLSSLTPGHSFVRSPACSSNPCRQRNMVATMAVAATERPTGMQRPDASGRFGKFGGKYVPETLITALAELEAAYAETKNDPAFKVSSQGASSCSLCCCAASCSCDHSCMASAVRVCCSAQRLCGPGVTLISC